MADLFYSLEETAAKLGKSEQELKDMVDGGSLHALRDSGKLVFKRDDIDAMTEPDQARLEDSSLGLTGLDETDSSIELLSEDTDTIELGQSPSGLPNMADSDASGSGIDVFDSGADKSTDPAAGTADDSGDQELALDSVGSGSGLLDLTRESDDTSLGAELLDEIYPGGTDSSDIGLDAPAGPSDSGTGMEDSAIELAVPSGTELAAQAEDQEGIPTESAVYEAAAMPTAVTMGEPSDPAGTAMVCGFTVGSVVALGMVMVLAIAGIMAVPVELTKFLTSDSNLMYVLIGLGVGSLILGVGGFLAGRSMSR
ncbi:MAG: helix-turn-helix domain-containing protein [Phycisphaeraceae bacterium]|jgi:hypothetical protein|nr:helix-turn-helix domain-containing protein [Phycisphaeraceae bacterium]